MSPPEDPPRRGPPRPTPIKLGYNGAEFIVLEVSNSLAVLPGTTLAEAEVQQLMTGHNVVIVWANDP